MLSIALGVGTFITSTEMLFNELKKDHQLAVVMPFSWKDSTALQDILNNGNVDTPGIKIIRNNGIQIDTIYYGPGFSDISSSTSLPAINRKALINLNPKVLRWVIFHSVSLSLSFASWLFLAYLAFQLFQEYKTNFKKFHYALWAAGIILALIAIIYISQKHSIILNGIEIMEYFNLVFIDPLRATFIILIPFFFMSLTPVTGIILVNMGAYFSFENRNQSNLNPDTSIDFREKYQTLKEDLNIFAFYLGFLVSCAVIGTGLQRDLIISQIGEENSNLLFPLELLHTYGIGFSLILALFFVPTYMYLQYAGRDFNTNDENPGKWWEIGKDTINNLKLVFSIFLPLLSSIIQPLINGS
jgi:hypothetical protein